MERRNVSVEFRFDEDTNRLIGEAIVFNKESRDLGGFIETISPDALTEARMDDIVLLFNHNPDHVLGRYTNERKSVDFKITERGVVIEATLPPTQLGKDLAILIARGDIDQMSFAFRIAENGDKWERRDDKYYRTINKIDTISDFSIVTRAAYPDTTVAVRSLDSFKDIKDNEDVRIDDEALRQQEDLQRQLQILRMRSDSH